MDVLSPDDLCELMAPRPSPCVSVYLPTPSHEGNGQYDRTRSRRQLLRVRQQLVQQGLIEGEIDELLAPAAVQADLTSFWEQRSEGWAFFSSPGFFRFFRLPMLFEQLVTSGPRFHITPMLSFLHGPDRFYLLALGQTARLYHASETSICELHLGGFPQTLQNAPSESLPTDSKNSTYGMLRGFEFGADLNQQSITQALEQIDHSVLAVLRGQQAPLILAAVGYLAAMYESVNSYPHLARGKVPGNPELWTDAELQSRAWRLVQPWFKKRQEDALADFDRAERNRLALRDISEVVLAAGEGRVETLLLAEGAQQVGRVDPDRRLVALDAAAAGGGEDLIDYAAAQTLVHGGAVLPLKPHLVPGDDSPVAAILRYAAS